ncbi:MAG: hypothetical protein DSZ11_04840 [Sulfurovum sp.]|nr:MAG: hypothetical protein DSZ11_04840 [Sulfurovum sp.]
MYNRYSFIMMITGSIFLVGCVPNHGVKTPTISTTPIIGSSPISEYGYPPQHYRETIKNYFSSKLKRGDKATYTFSTPKRAFKRKGLAYGGDISWKGWLVDVAVMAQSRTGRVLSPKPYMVLFKDSVIIEDIMGSKHALLTRLGE